MKRLPVAAVLTAGLMLTMAASLVMSRAADPPAASAAKSEKEKVGDQEKAKEKPRSETKRRLSEYMRLKLAASSKILEGLAVEDMELVEEGAKTLNEMSGEEKFRVHTDVLYRQFSTDFQQTTKELVAAAKDRNLDRAALKWMDATMGCIECHRYVRTILLTGAESRSQP